MAVNASAVGLMANSLSATWQCRSQHIPLIALRHVVRRRLAPKYQRQSLQIACTARPRRKDVQLATRKVPCRSFALAASLSWIAQLANKAKVQAQEDDPTPFFEPLLRSFVLGLGTGALFEASHVSWKVCASCCSVHFVDGYLCWSGRLLTSCSCNFSTCGCDLTPMIGAAVHFPIE